MTSAHRPSAAIIGAGMSGLTCARALQAAGFHVEVFDKSRGTGGRLATRRADYGTFDHGAQYFTARDPAFRAAVAAWTQSGDVAVWSPRLIALDGTTDSPVPAPVSDSTIRHVGVGSMSRIGRMLAEGLQLHLQCPIQAADRVAGRWKLQAGTGAVPSVQVPDSGFDWLVAAIPSPQAADLFLQAPALQAQALALPMVPCWALLLRFDAPLQVPYDAAFINGSSLTWIARNASRPGRDPAECRVVHAARDWSETHLGRSPDAIVAPMLAEFARVTGITVTPAAAYAHRWRYSGPAATTDARCLFDAELGAGACGDWLSGSRVEGAFLSGRDLAERIIACSRAG
jgi:predicted NAD/FAD-dependent oxidoreductase